MADELRGPPTKAGATVRVNTTTGDFPQELNSNSPMTVTAINPDTGMATLKRESTILGEFPAHVLTEVAAPVDNPPPLSPPDAVVEVELVAPTPEPPPPQEPTPEPQPGPMP